MGKILKDLEFCDSSFKDFKKFPKDVIQNTGYQLDRIQRGLNPLDWKPMSSVGLGVKEIRLKDQAGIYRVIYYAKLKDIVYVLHAFSKKTEKTAVSDIKTAKKRLKKYTSMEKYNEQ